MGIGSEDSDEATFEEDDDLERLLLREPERPRFSCFFRSFLPFLLECLAAAEEEDEWLEEEEEFEDDATLFFLRS